MLKYNLDSGVKELINNTKSNNFIQKDSFLRTILLAKDNDVLKAKELKLKDYEGMLFVFFDPQDGSMTIGDNGIGYNKEELIELMNFKDNSNILPVFQVAKYISIISQKITEEITYKCTIKDDEIIVNPCICDENPVTVMYIKFEDEFAKEFTNKEKLITYINKFIGEIKNDLYINYFDDLEEKMDKLN
ncbi:hypothetical protein ACN2EN_07940 [Aliarcobacter lanthieri]|uniref:ATP-binding protein n=1 Tax=Aliarcobacter butzleri TaxID=28197 RepID=A0AAW7QA73_9BACT|nr:hypothetical protein [Aliarcobacter butzleri]MDN5106578.1 hypothetical protein [Aliarcobacter butzleri]MDN5123300.1 hypothetical protein [Aliarcobacter butzleri]RBQ30361.1 hypothetical protein CRU92_12580 [Arcobacter sp. FW59]